MSVRGLPSSTEIRKPVHKKLLYAKFSAELSRERKKQFDEDIGMNFIKYNSNKELQEVKYWELGEETVKAVAQEKPYYAVFRDSCMANDSVVTNFEQIFATYSPETVRKVL